MTGEGLNVTIRGLGTNFTRVLLNGAPVAVASTGRTDSQNTNREVDLDMF
ncbi:TonB-dependent receptor plug domain-containing protein, partial [Acinetobacter baumannii]